MSHDELVEKLRTLSDDPDLRWRQRDVIDRAADLIEAQAREVAGAGWQPIETAPKDGTPIIGAFFAIRWADSHRKHDVVRCWWQPEFEAFISSCRQMTMAPGYTVNGKTSELHSAVVEPITHWMPMPLLGSGRTLADAPSEIERLKKERDEARELIADMTRVVRLYGEHDKLTDRLKLGALLNHPHFARAVLSPGEEG